MDFKKNNRSWTIAPSFSAPPSSSNFVLQCCYFRQVGVPPSLVLLNFPVPEHSLPVAAFSVCSLEKTAAFLGLPSHSLSVLSPPLVAVKIIQSPWTLCTSAGVTIFHTFMPFCTAVLLHMQLCRCGESLRGAFGPAL